MCPSKSYCLWGSERRGGREAEGDEGAQRGDAERVELLVEGALGKDVEEMHDDVVACPRAGLSLSADLHCTFARTHTTIAVVEHVHQLMNISTRNDRLARGYCSRG